MSKYISANHALASCSICSIQEPIEIRLGEQYYSNTMSGTKRRKVSTYDKFYYVPLLETLRRLLQTDEYMSEVLNPHKSKSSILSDFCDGVTFKDHPLFQSDVNALQIVGYYDELEIVNPIGTYVKKHKLGCLFFVLSNVRSQFRSTLKAINLVAVARNEDIVKYGLDCVLRPFVQDLKKLYCDGISIRVGLEHRTFYGGLLAFLADNLAAHAIGGFKESMSFSLRICRSCMITRPQSKECCTETTCTLRTAEDHFEQTQLLDGPLKGHHSTNFGINRESILNEVPGFSVINGLHHDIMHDLCEGVIPYEMKLLLHHCIESNYFTVQQLNDRLTKYDFPENKPSLIDARVLNNSDRKLRQSASQMLTLCQELPLLIGDKVEEGDEKWDSFLMLVKICSIAISPSISYNTISYLRLLIEEKLVIFRNLYPHEVLTPKQHYMLHYASQIERSGPLIHSWTMRHESKLSFIKRVSRCGNFKNVTQTAAKSHQLWQCQKIQSDELILHPDITFSPKVVNSSLKDEAQHIKDMVRKELLPVQPNVDAHVDSESVPVTHPNWVKVQSTKYTKGAYVIVKYDPIDPVFGKIVDILLVDKTVVLSLEKFVSQYFYPHYNAFVVSSSAGLLALQQHRLEYHKVLYGRNSFVRYDLKCYVTLPHLY